MRADGKTAFETSPVESLFDAIASFTAAFDVFQHELDCSDENKEFLEILKSALYKPVYPKEGGGPFCLFEIGVMYVPGGKCGGTYTVNGEKLAIALAERESDIKALFAQEDGLLCDVNRLITDFLEKELPDDVYVKAKGFLNECQRLEAMF